MIEEEWIELNRVLNEIERKSLPSFQLEGKKNQFSFFVAGEHSVCVLLCSFIQMKNEKKL